MITTTEKEKLKKILKCANAKNCLVSVQINPCEVILGITLEETECHIVNPKPLDQCNARTETETVR